MCNEDDEQRCKKCEMMPKNGMKIEKVVDRMKEEQKVRRIRRIEKVRVRGDQECLYERGCTVCSTSLADRT